MGPRGERTARLRLALGGTAATGILLLARVPSGLLEAERELLARLPADKLVHLALFGALVGLWLRWLEAGARRGSAASWLVVLLVTLYGGALELLQPLFARSAEWGDLAADAAGALAAGLWGRRARTRPL